MGSEAKGQQCLPGKTLRQEWAIKTYEKNTTGVLLWDLSAAFDTLDSGINCDKLKLYGFQESTVGWFRSFMYAKTLPI